MNLEKLRELNAKVNTEKWVTEVSWCHEPTIPQAGIGDNCLSPQIAEYLCLLVNSASALLDVVEASMKYMTTGHGRVALCNALARLEGGNETKTKLAIQNIDL